MTIAPEADEARVARRFARFAHYAALQETKRYLKPEALKQGCLYLIHARNSHIGRWNKTRGFDILREKFDHIRLDHELHWDLDSSYGTVKPLVKISKPVAKKNLRATLARKLSAIPYEKHMELTKEFAVNAASRGSKIMEGTK
jgi:hypothetical protein